MPIKVKQEVRRGFDFVPGYIEDFLRSGGKEQIVAAVNSDMQRDGRLSLIHISCGFQRVTCIKAARCPRRLSF